MIPRMIPSQAVPRPISRPRDASMSLRAFAPTKIAGIPVKRPQQNIETRPSQKAFLARLYVRPSNKGSDGDGAGMVLGLGGGDDCCVWQ